jgi:hypothetical protein
MGNEETRSLQSCFAKKENTASCGGGKDVDQVTVKELVWWTSSHFYSTLVSIPDIFLGWGGVGANIKMNLKILCIDNY